ncbi:MAG: hypothetical protein V4647_08675 [Pseudomonadota bacterium]
MPLFVRAGPIVPLGLLGLLVPSPSDPSPVINTEALGEGRDLSEMQ